MTRSKIKVKSPRNEERNFKNVSPWRDENSREQWIDTFESDKDLKKHFEKKIFLIHHQTIAGMLRSGFSSKNVKSLWELKPNAPLWPRKTNKNLWHKSSHNNRFGGDFFSTAFARSSLIFRVMSFLAPMISFLALIEICVTKTRFFIDARN